MVIESPLKMSKPNLCWQNTMLSARVGVGLSASCKMEENVYVGQKETRKIEKMGGGRRLCV